MLFSEALRSITANASTTVAATMTVLIGMFLLGLFIALGTWVVSWSNQAEKKLLVKVFFCTPLTCGAEANQAQIDKTRQFILSIDQVPADGVKFVSKDEAIKRMEKTNPELVENLSTNPLPHAYEITPENAGDVSVIANRIDTARAAGRLPGVEKVNYAKKVADRILRVASVVSAIFLVAVIVLVIASTLLIANTIRLSIFARRREIEVMKLVGATNWFVRGPFMIEGLLTGLAGSAIAIVLLVLGKELALPTILGRIDDSGVGAIGFFWNALILLGVGLLLGALGSGLTLRRFLRV
jgi:cell division transport system permease protein